MNFKIGKADASISAKISTEDNSIIVELYLSGENAKKNYSIHSSKKEEIENQLNANLDWFEHPSNGPHKIYLKTFESDFSNRNDWERRHGWLKEALLRFYSVFYPLCKQLPNLS